MDLNKEYRLMCLEATELQNNWSPDIGDYMIAKASYCTSGYCSEEKPCPDCLESDNVYVISGKYNYAESVGGTHWFFGGEACVKGIGNICNDTHCSIMCEKGYSTIKPSPWRCSKEDMLWLPRQDQLQSMVGFGYTNQYKVRKFLEWLDTEAYYNPHTYSLEMLWLMFYMRKTFRKKWNPMPNIKEWKSI